MKVVLFIITLILVLILLEKNYSHEKPGVPKNIELDEQIYDIEKNSRK